MRSIIEQIRAPLSKLPACVMDLYQLYRAGRPPRQAFVETVMTLFTESDQVYLLIDALSDSQEH